MNVIYSGEADARAFRDALSGFIKGTLESDPDFVYLDSDLMSCIGTAGLLNQSARAINCGIAEANMIGIAAGLSAVGYKPLCHSFGTFASRRCFDQVFLSGGYAKNNLTIIGSDPGVCAAFNGGTHMPFEDMALMRAIPEAMVFDISDIPQLVSVLKQVYAMPGVKYIRMDRKNPVKVYAENQEFALGKGVTLRDGCDAAVIASGIMVEKALKASELLRQEGIDITVVDMYQVKPLDTELLFECVKRTGTIITAENHNRIGGLYSAVCEAVAGRAPVRCVAVEDRFGEVGQKAYLEEVFGLTAGHIVSVVEDAVRSKKHE